MRISLHLPPPPLRAWVEALWIVRGADPGRRERVLPNGAIELIVNLGAPHAVVRPDGSRDLHRRAWVAGLQEGPIVIEATRDTDLLGVRFRPGGLGPFLRAPAGELTGLVVEHDDLFGRDLEPLLEALLAARGDAARLRALEGFLLARVEPDRAPPTWVGRALDAFADPEAPPAIGALARELGVSHKHLIATFRRTVGTTPRHLARILRLQAAIRAASGARAVDWAALAAACGYYDQSHLIRDFKRLAGATPGEYLARRDEDENHMRG